MRTTSFFSGVAASFGTLGLAASAAVAQVSLPVIGRPVSGGIGFQTPGTELARDLQGLDHFLLVIIGAITVFVTLLLAWVLVRYNQRVNKTPATFTHNSPLEVAWTVVPIVILVFIGAFSLPVLFKQEEIPAADINIKVTGSQWFWSYEYPDDGVSFDSFLIGEGKVMNASVEAELVAAGYTKEDFLLATDTALVLPVNKTVVVQLTATDVIHAWMVPALGVQLSAVPGRLNQLWFKAEQEGVYFGQCSTLCGKDHAYMPITIKVVSQDVYDKWLEQAKGGDVTLASNSAMVKLAAAN